jgi:nitrate/nitrite-specific signal transduction histidine kinase
MGHSIRGRLILAFIGLAVGPLLVVAIILALLSYISPQQAPTGVSDPTINLVIVTLILAVVMAGIAGVLGILFARRIIEPIQTLTEAAGAMGSGDLSARPLIPSDDEIGILAGTFNSTARQLRDRIGTLEHRVAEQTKALATFREISRLSAMLEEKQLVTEVVERVQKAFHYYHAQIFFYDETGENLILAGGTGEAGQKLLVEGHTVPKGKGPVGRAAESNTPVLIGDTSHDPGALPNPILPKTRSEAAVPIAAGDQVLGVLDVQQNITNGMTQADVVLLQSIANQMALAVRKTRAYSPDRHQAEREALIASIDQKIRETTSVENALRVAALELGRALGSRETRIVISAHPLADEAEFKTEEGR